MPFPAEKRKENRVTLRKPVVLTWRSDNGVGSGTVSNMSPQGCYVLTSSPRHSGERFNAFLDTDAPEIKCEVRYVDEHVGMGIRFLDLTSETMEQIQTFLRARAVTA